MVMPMGIVMVKWWWLWF